MFVYKIQVGREVIQFRNFVHLHFDIVFFLPEIELLCLPGSGFLHGISLSPGYPGVGQSPARPTPGRRGTSQSNFGPRDVKNFKF